MDGGAVAADGTVEKDLNLDIALKLRNRLSESGYKVVMTRSGDDALSDTKKEDMRSRLKMMQEHRDALFLSIHCNKFPSSSAKGLQVFYTNNTESSKDLAQLIQNDYNSQINKSCKRKPKAADKSIYLLSNAPCDAVLIECGFVSNSTELELLKDEAYRQDLADMITSSVNRFYEAGM